MWLKRRPKISEQHLKIKLKISSGTIHCDGLGRPTACLMSELEIRGKFKKSENVKRTLLGITIEEGLEIE
jgi:hypothetical protein